MTSLLRCGRSCLPLELGTKGLTCFRCTEAASVSNKLLNVAYLGLKLKAVARQRLYYSAATVKPSALVIYNLVQ